MATEIVGSLRERQAAEPETEEVEALRAANAMLRSWLGPAAQVTIAQIVAYAENIAWQAGVGSLETAGQIVSFLADRPELLPAFMDGSLSAIDTDLLDHHAGRLTWHGMDGKVYAPDPAKAGRFRDPAGLAPAPATPPRIVPGHPEDRV
ncbi:hypothetical protein ASG54_22610 [Aureimonas sp. Leaf460]|nr:hypothetical protein ASG62_16450 [Aureimonas sp. Leaf427]KQT65750.1 hypothetical protein ASG54_22610 [Aureimonas sp. Leaf460]